MIGPYVTVTPLISVAVVTVLISWRLDFHGIPEFVSDGPLCVSFSRRFALVLDSLLSLMPLLGFLRCHLLCGLYDFEV